jgi:hypothetical protein
MSRRPRLTRAVRRAVGRLLDMEYRPRELAEVLGVHKDTVYRGWVPAGLPHRREPTGELWIVGTEAAAWLMSQTDGQSISLGEGQFYCMRCRESVTAEVEHRRAEQHADLLFGTCPMCGRRVARFVRAIESADDQPA